MTPEELRTYLVTRRFEEDVVQDVIVDYLAAVPGSIRFPKSWGYRAALNRRIDQARHAKRQDELPTIPLRSSEADPLRHAEARQELARALKRGPYRRRVVRFKRSREDYRALVRHDSQSPRPA